MTKLSTVLLFLLPAAVWPQVNVETVLDQVRTGVKPDEAMAYMRDVYSTDRWFSFPKFQQTAEYLKRLSRYAACDAQELASEAALLKLVEKSAARTQPVLVLLDSRGRQLTSEEIANFLEYHLAHDTQDLWFAVGPADGWTAATRAKAGGG